MVALVRFELEDGGAVLIEADEEESGIEQAARGDGFVLQATASFDAAMEGVQSAANAAVRKLRRVAQVPDELEIQFGIRLNAQAGAVIAKTGVEGHLQVRATWRGHDDGSGAARPDGPH